MAGSPIFSIGKDDSAGDHGGDDGYRPKVVEQNDIGEFARTDAAVVAVDAKTLCDVQGGVLEGLYRIEACFDQDSQAMVQVTLMKQIVGMDVIRAELKSKTILYPNEVSPPADEASGAFLGSAGICLPFGRQYIRHLPA